MVCKIFEKCNVQYNQYDAVGRLIGLRVFSVKFKAFHTKKRRKYKVFFNGHTKDAYQNVRTVTEKSVLSSRQTSRTYFLPASVRVSGLQFYPLFTT